MRKLFALAALSLALLPCSVKAQTLDSTYVHVNIGNYGAALFGFGPKSSPLIGSTAVSVGCGSDGNGLYTVYTNYGTPSQQTSARIPLTCTITTSPDPDGDSNQLASVVVNSSQSGTVGGQTVKLNSASYQSERIGGHSQNETIGGAAQITIGTATAKVHYPCGIEHWDCLHAAKDLHPVPYCEHARCECPPHYSYNEYAMKCERS